MFKARVRDSTKSFFWSLFANGYEYLCDGWNVWQNEVTTNEVLTDKDWSEISKLLVLALKIVCIEFQIMSIKQSKFMPKYVNLGILFAFNLYFVMNGCYCHKSRFK